MYAVERAAEALDLWFMNFLHYDGEEWQPIIDESGKVSNYFVKLGGVEMKMWSLISRMCCHVVSLLMSQSSNFVIKLN